MKWSHAAARLLGPGVVFVPVAVLAVGCSGPATPAATAAASAGTIRVSGAFIPQPASPDVAAAYFTVRNTGSSADTLLDASTPVARTSVAMREGPGGTSSPTAGTSGGMAGMPGMDGGSGMDGMTPLGPLTIPGHSSVRFSPGDDHLMLEGLDARLRTGDTVTLELHFARAGIVAVTVPVVPLDAILGSGGGA